VLLTVGRHPERSFGRRFRAYAVTRSPLRTAVPARPGHGLPSTLRDQTAVFEPLLLAASAKRASAFCEHMLGPRTCAHGFEGQCCLRLLAGKTRDGASGWGAYGGKYFPSQPTGQASSGPRVYRRLATSNPDHQSSRTGHAAVSIGAHGNSSSDEMASTGSVTLGADNLRSAGSRSCTSPAGTGHSAAVRENVGRPESMKQARPERARRNVGKG
jgi:hypothetical protein